MTAPTDSLFIALRRYRPQKDRDPVEDFVTEAFAWLLRQAPGWADAFLQHVRARLGPTAALAGTEAATWKTQVRTPQGILDMVALTPGLTIVFEHKVWSSVGSTQVSRYRAAAQAKWGAPVAVIVIGGGARQMSADADLNLRWSDVHGLLSAWAARQPAPVPLVGDFLALLVHEGLGPVAPISEESIRSYLPARPLKDRLMQATRPLPARDWSFIYSTLTDAGSTLTRPYLRWGKKVNNPADGRVGIDFFRHWRPGLFAGVILDWEDHAVPPLDPNLGPDFSIVVDYSLKPTTQPTVDAFIRADPYTALRARLTESCGDWDFVDHIFTDPKPNRWHPLHLRRPLASILRGTATLEQQTDALYNAARAGLELLLAGGELKDLEALRSPAATASPGVPATVRTSAPDPALIEEPV